VTHAARFSAVSFSVVTFSVVFSVSTLLVLSNCACRHDAGEAPLSKLLRSSELESFSLQDTHARRHSTVYTLARGDGDATEIIKVEAIAGIDGEAAEVLLDESILSLEALYAAALSPYPGDISKQVAPNSKYRPRRDETTVGATKRTWFLLFANDRMAFGAATPESVRYRALLGWFHCAERETFFKVRCFVPRTTKEEALVALFLSLQCS